MQHFPVLDARDIQLTPGTRLNAGPRLQQKKVDTSGLGAVQRSFFPRTHGIFYTGLCVVGSPYKSRTSKTAKCKAPFGSDSKNCAPAPLERVTHVSGRIAPNDPFVCSNVLITFAGWSEVCATLREKNQASGTGDTACLHYFVSSHVHLEISESPSEKRTLCCNVTVLCLASNHVCSSVQLRNATR